MFKSILVPFDFSDGSRAALRLATKLALQEQATLTLLHVYLVPVPILAGGAAWPTTLGAVDQTTRKEMERIRSELPPALKDARVEVLTGDPGLRICDYANDTDVDLIVMGTHGRTGVSRILIGSVAERVVRHAPCPVLTVPRAANSTT